VFRELDSVSIMRSLSLPMINAHVQSNRVALI